MLYFHFARNLDDIFSEIINEPIKKTDVVLDPVVDTKKLNTSSTVLAKVVLAYRS